MMSELDPTTLRRELLLQEGIDKQLDPLVRQANTTAAKLKESPRMEESQLRNLLNASIESGSIEVVINFIRYQIARSGSAWGTAPDSFGHAVIRDLRETLPVWTDKVMAFVQSQKDSPALSDDERSRIEVRLMQLYLGYLNRAFYYGKKTGEFDKLTEVAHAG
jgi:hypothetical protein